MLIYTVLPREHSQRSASGSYEFMPGRLEDHTPERLRGVLGKIDLILASPECTNHSPAKGNAPRCEQSRRTAFEVIRYAEVFKPRWIVIENVVNMRRWQRYDELLDGLHALEYSTHPMILNASDFGVPQDRRRLFILCTRDEISDVRPSFKGRSRTVRDILDDRCDDRMTCLCHPKRAKATLERAERAISTIGTGKEFLLVYYGSDGAGGWQHLDRPLRTVTTLDRFALVRPTRQGHMMRMLQVPELKKAMGMPTRFIPGLGSRRDQIRAIGNAVCPPVMRSVVRSLITSHAA
jgi:DNA (cytosine-5)-methyltransferase 1